MRRLFAVLAPLVIAGAAHAQQCVGTDTPEQCWARFNPSIAATSSVAADLATTNTAVPGMTMPNGTSLRDFLSIFSAGLQTATVTESQNAVTLDWNLPFNIFGDDKIKLQTVFAEPALSGDVKNAVANNSAAVAKLNDTLAQTYDIQASFSFAPENRRLGRSIRHHEEHLNALVASAIGDTERSQLLALARMQLAPGQPLGDKAAELESLARTEQQLGAQHQEVVDAFAMLLNNQPQLYGTVVYRTRDELAGPNEYSIKVTYESAANSLNQFLRRNADRCGTPAKILANPGGLADSTSCSGTLSAFAKQAGGDVNAGASNRLAISIEYKQMQSNRFDITDPVAVHVETPGVHSLVYSIAYGIPLATTVPNREGRFDIAINYDNVSDDANRKDRLVGSVTYSQKLTDTLVLPLSLVYANHADYLPASGKRLGVHFGLNYKLPDSTP